MRDVDRKQGKGLNAKIQWRYGAKDGIGGGMLKIVFFVSTIGAIISKRQKAKLEEYKRGELPE